MAAGRCCAGIRTYIILEILNISAGNENPTFPFCCCLTPFGGYSSKQLRDFEKAQELQSKLRRALSVSDQLDFVRADTSVCSFTWVRVFWKRAALSNIIVLTVTLHARSTRSHTQLGEDELLPVGKDAFKGKQVLVAGGNGRLGAQGVFFSYAPDFFDLTFYSCVSLSLCLSVFVSVCLLHLSL